MQVRKEQAGPGSGSAHTPVRGPRENQGDRPDPGTGQEDQSGLGQGLSGQGGSGSELGQGGDPQDTPSDRYTRAGQGSPGGQGGGVPSRAPADRQDGAGKPST